ncbi:MAG TPA: hypothetical protein VJG65_02735 [Patescibacteria group bacterium]|nr:hypothetical protein [Patescibacteria group bacterium]
MEQQQPSQGGGTNYAVSAKNKKKGLALIIGPFICLVFVFIAYAVATFVVAQMYGLSVEESANTPANEIGSGVLNIINVILGFIGILSIIGILIGIPLGIVFLNKKELVSGVFDDRSGNGKNSIVPEEIKGWNWGAAGLTWIWGVWHGVWISLLSIIPLINIIMVIVLGLKGNEWAWRSQKWESIEKFNASQNKWKPWGIVFLVLMILGLLYQFLSPSSS